MRALYNVGRYITSYNFIEWLVQVKTLGATMVVFDRRRLRTDKWPLPIAERRFQSICVDGVALAGLPYELVPNDMNADPRARHIAEPGGAQMMRFWRTYERIDRLKSPIGKRSERFTVTLRKTQRAPARNSDEVVWRDFAKEIGARVIPDYDEQPIHIHERMALYAGAQMNFFVANGPMVMCSFSEYPLMAFNSCQSWGDYRGNGMPEWGAQFPWLLDNQRMIWEMATPESLRRHFYNWRDGKPWLPHPVSPESFDAVMEG